MGLGLALVKESPCVPGEGEAALGPGQGLRLPTFLEKGLGKIGVGEAQGSSTHLCHLPSGLREG